jgi:hypothetical protein
MTAAAICGWFLALASFSGAFLAVVIIIGAVELTDRLARRRQQRGGTR